MSATTIPLSFIRCDGGTQPREDAWVQEHAKHLAGGGTRLVGLCMEPLTTALIAPSEYSDAYHIRVDLGSSISATRRPVKLAFLPVQMESLGFDYAGARWKAEPADDPSGLSGDVYFIQAVQGGPIKIGKAGAPEHRLSNIQRMSPVPLRVLATIPGGGFKLERQLHRRFASSRSHGEWFHPTPALLALIAEHAK